MYFERYTSPTREAIHERYYRQPIMGRWLCKKSVIEEFVQKWNLSIYYASRIEMEDKFK